MRGEVFVNPSRPVLRRSWPVHTPSQTNQVCVNSGRLVLFRGRPVHTPIPAKVQGLRCRMSLVGGGSEKERVSHEVVRKIFVSRIVYRRAFISSVIVKIYESHAGSKKALLFQTKPSKRCMNPVYMQPENVVPPARA